MRQKTERQQGAAERTIKDIRRQTRKRYSPEEKIRIVLAGLRAVVRPMSLTSRACCLTMVQVTLPAISLSGWNAKT